MLFSSKLFFASCATLVVGATVLHSAQPPSGAPTRVDASTQEVTAVPSGLLPSGLAPMKYFVQSCERCHGPHGDFYGSEFGKNLTDEKLHQFVHDMAMGPGGAPLQGEPLEALVAYHRSLIQKMPFVVVTQWKENVLRGEATPNAEILVCWPETIDGKTTRKETKATREGDNWNVTLPAGVDVKTIQITAQIGEAKTVLALPDEYSHRAVKETKTADSTSQEKP